MANYSSRACVYCRCGKRKCDKALPRCSRCARLDLRCEYEETAISVQSRSSSKSMTLFPAHFSHWNTSTQNFFRSTYEAFIIQDLRFRDDYLHSIHKWLPIIDEKVIIANSSHDTDPITMLLLMAVHLIVQRPDEHADRLQVLDKEYCAVRHFYFRNLAEMPAKPSIKLLQSGILIATYEYGHGLIESAWHTLGPCLSAGMTLGLQNLSGSLNKSQGTDMNSQKEERLVWWAICITERILCLSFPAGNRTPLARSMDESQFLAELQDTSSFSSPYLRTFYGSNFYHQIQSCILIRQVLSLIVAQDPLSAQNQTQSDLLDANIQRAMHINLQLEIDHLTSVSESLALNRSALMILHQWRYNTETSAGHTQSVERSRMVIDSITNAMVDTVHEFLPRTYAGWKKSHHPHGIQTVFMAAKELKANMNNNHGLEELLEMLRIQSHRWCIAKKYLGILEEGS